MCRREFKWVAWTWSTCYETFNIKSQKWVRRPRSEWPPYRPALNRGLLAKWHDGLDLRRENRKQTVHRSKLYFILKPLSWLLLVLVLFKLGQRIKFDETGDHGESVRSWANICVWALRDKCPKLPWGLQSQTFSIAATLPQPAFSVR